jgi:uncharacterized repeat protein (TIGR03803 family)
VFSYDLDSGKFSVVASLSGDEGSGPFGSLTLVGSTLYGLAEGGGSDGQGVIYSVAIPEPGMFPIFAVSGVFLLRRRRD